MDLSPEQADATGKLTRWQSFQHMLLRSLWLLFAVAVLFVITRIIRPAPCWGLFLLVSLVSWPIWRYRIEYLLFRRRLVLDGVMQSASRVRRLLWTGNITKGFQVVVSMCLAWLLLTLVFQLSRQHWWLLTADAVFLALIYIPVTRGLSATINTHHLGAVVRRWPLFLVNGLVLTAVFMLLDFAVVGAPDTRQLAWNTLAEQIYLTNYSDAGCVLWGVSAGAMAVVEALAWHGSQLVIPNLPDMSARIIAWSFFLLRAATVAWLFTAMLLGICVVLEKRLLKGHGHKGGSTVSRAFFITIILLALPFFYAAIIFEPPVFPGADEPVFPCEQDVAQREQLHARLDGDVEAERQQAQQTVAEEVTRELDVLFDDIEQGVDGYLDWYFTVIGEYERLAAVFTADVAHTMREQLEKHLFTDSDFDAQLGMLDRELEQMTTGRFALLAPQLRQELANVSCAVGDVTLLPVSELNHDTLRASVAATSGVGAGIVASKALASKTTAAVVGKVAAKKTFQTGAALATKTLAKKGSSTLLSAGVGTALCAPTGPVAILCGVTAGLVTWFTVDKVLIELDEVLNREEMHADILMVLDEQKALLGEQLTEKHYARIDLMASHVNAAVQRTFVPAQDGIDMNPENQGSR
jgi:hypothetical protein